MRHAAILSSLSLPRIAILRASSEGLGTPNQLERIAEIRFCTQAFLQTPVPVGRIEGKRNRQSLPLPDVEMEWSCEGVAIKDDCYRSA